MSACFRLYSAQDWPGLLEMYRTFEPKAAYQGLPPVKEEVMRRWLADLTANPRNTNFILALDREVIAHAALVYYPTHPREEEIIIFVHQVHQDQGWGRELFLAAMNWACLHNKLLRVWLSVEWHNVRAQRLYRSIGFVPVPSQMGEVDLEIDMERPLQCQECLKDECPIFSARLMRPQVLM
jgi:RimJ/RimL family protein N-acetyltransferase